MTRKVLLDVDPGIDDALALSIALTHPDIEVVAVTAVGGNCSPERATRNVQAIIEQLDPPRWPRIGTASAPDNGLPVDGRFLFGLDGLGGVEFEVAELRTPHPSEKVMADAIRSAPNNLTIIALGPLTNIARVLQRDPILSSQIGQIIMMGGSVAGPGNITPMAEFNVYCDPQSARAVFRSPSTKTLIPLDVTNQVVLNFDLLQHLPDESSKTGAFLQKILPPVFRAYHQQFGLEGIHVHDTVALMAALYPELFITKEMAGDVETEGELTNGMTIFDRRRVPAWQHNMEVAVTIDPEKVRKQLIDCLLHR
jgi:inosine-uridine nucleoside N-ribohydrolase